MSKVSYDHLGNKYSSVSKMCRAYGIDSTTYTRRREHGLSVEEALLLPLYTPWYVTDHLGNKYYAEGDMCKAYGIPQSTFVRRRKSNWSLEDILTAPPLNKSSTFYGFKITKGVTFDDAPYYKCECLVCGHKDFLNPSEMKKGCPECIRRQR